MEFLFTKHPMSIEKKKTINFNINLFLSNYEAFCNLEKKVPEESIYHLNKMPLATLRVNGGRALIHIP